MIRAVLFDVDGVLLNGESFAVQLERDYGISNAMLQPFFTGEFLSSTIGAADMKALLPPYLSEWGWRGSVDDFVEYWFKAEHVVDEPLVEYVDQLRTVGIRCYLATNQEQHRTAYVLEQVGFDQQFDGWFVSSEMGVKKPDPAFFEQVVARMEPLAANELLFWDDRQDNVDAAAAVGMQSKRYTSFDDFEHTMERLLS